MKIVKIINESLENLTIGIEKAKIDMSNGGFEISICLYQIVPIEDVLTLNEMANKIYADCKENGYETDKPFCIEIVDGKMFFNASFYEEQEEVE